MNRYLIAFALLLFAQCSLAQSNVLKGEVVYLNSGKRPVVGISISGHGQSAGQATPTYSNAQGQFQLQFPQAQPGDLVQLNIGLSTPAGDTLEVVNQDELRLCRLPDGQDQAPVRIVVCPKGARAHAAQQYYQIVKTSSDLALETQKQIFQQLLDAQNKNYDSIAQMSKAIERLYHQCDSLHYYKQALALASINKDYASKRTLEYLRRIENGETVQAAREVLDVGAATAQLGDGLARAMSAIEELETRAKASEVVFDYGDAVRCYENLITLEKTNLIPKHRLVFIYNDISVAYSNNGRDREALQFSKKITSKEIAYLHDSLKFITYKNISLHYSSVGLYTEAVHFILKAIEVKESASATEDLDMAEAYHALSGTYHYMGDYEKSIFFVKKSIEIIEKKLNSNHPSLVMPYTTLAATWGMMEQFDQAGQAIKKAIFIQTQKSDSIKPNLMYIYNIAGNIYNSAGLYKEALNFYFRSEAIGRYFFDSLHISLVTLYSNIGSCYTYMKNPKLSIKFLKKSIFILEKNFPRNHPTFAAAYNNIAVVYAAMGEREKALNALYKSIKINECIKNSYYVLCQNYNNACTMLIPLNKIKEAIKYGEKCISLFEVHEDTLSIVLSSAYQNTAVAYCHDDNPFKCISYFLKSLNILEKNNASTYKTIINTRNAMFRFKTNLRRRAFAKFKKNHRINIVILLHHAAQNHQTKALKHLEKALQHGYTDLKFLEEEETFDSIREHPKFKRLLRQLRQKLDQQKAPATNPHF